MKNFKTPDLPKVVCGFGCGFARTSRELVRKHMNIQNCLPAKAMNPERRAEILAEFHKEGAASWKSKVKKSEVPHPCPACGIPFNSVWRLNEHLKNVKKCRPMKFDEEGYKEEAKTEAVPVEEDSKEASLAVGVETEPMEDIDYIEEIKTTTTNATGAQIVPSGDDEQGIRTTNTNKTGFDDLTKITARAQLDGGFTEEMKHPPKKIHRRHSVDCGCGVSVSSNNFKAHRKSKDHIDWLKTVKMAIVKYCLVRSQTIIKENEIASRNEILEIQRKEGEVRRETFVPIDAEPDPATQEEASTIMELAKIAKANGLTIDVAIAFYVNVGANIDDLLAYLANHASVRLWTDWEDIQIFNSHELKNTSPIDVEKRLTFINGSLSRGPDLRGRLKLASKLLEKLDKYFVPVKVMPAAPKPYFLPRLRRKRREPEVASPRDPKDLEDGERAFFLHEGDFEKADSDPEIRRRVNAFIHNIPKYRERARRNFGCESTKISRGSNSIERMWNTYPCLEVNEDRTIFTVCSCGGCPLLSHGNRNIRIPSMDTILPPLTEPVDEDDEFLREFRESRKRHNTLSELHCMLDPTRIKERQKLGKDQGKPRGRTTQENTKKRRAEAEKWPRLAEAYRKKDSEKR